MLDFNSQNHRFIHDNSERLFDSNSRLIAANNESIAQELHLISNRVNDQIELIAEMILSAQNIKPLIDESSEIRTAIMEYNSLVKSIESTDLHYLETSSLDILDRLGIGRGGRRLSSAEGTSKVSGVMMKT